MPPGFLNQVSILVSVTHNSGNSLNPSMVDWVVNLCPGEKSGKTLFKDFLKDLSQVDDLLLLNHHILV